MTELEQVESEVDAKVAEIENRYYQIRPEILKLLLLEGYNMGIAAANELIK